MRCELVVGRLIAHACGREASGTCARCQSSVCVTHYDPELNLCTICSGDHEVSTAPIALEDLGDPLTFAPEVYAALKSRPGAPPDELTGIDS